MTLFICSSCRNLQGTVFCIDRQSDNLNNRLKLSDYTLDRAGNSMITDRDTIYRLALLLGNDTTGYGNWKQYYRIPFDGNRTMRLVLDGGDDPGPREYLILHDEHGKIVRYIEIAAEYGDGPRSKKIYSVLTKDSLYVYTVTTEAFLTGDDFIDDTTGYGNWKQYYRIPFDGNRTMRLVLDGGDDPGPREYLILHDEHGKIVRYIEIAAEYGDGPRSKKIYSVLTKDSLYVYTVTTEAFLTGDDFIDDTKPATADTMKKSYHIGDLTAIYR